MSGLLAVAPPTGPLGDGGVVVERLLRLDDVAFREMFAGSPIKRIGRNRMIRNCLVAAGNSRSEALVASVESHLDDPDPVIAEAAGWAMDRLQDRNSEAMHCG